MADSVYRVTEVIGVSSESWEAAARIAVETAAKTVRDLRIAEVVRQDVTIADGGVVNFRVRLAISFGTNPATDRRAGRSRAGSARLVRAEGGVDIRMTGSERADARRIDPLLASVRPEEGNVHATTLSANTATTPAMTAAAFMVGHRLACQHDKCPAQVR
jgi:flavin-binding protein dodecin